MYSRLTIRRARPGNGHGSRDLASAAPTHLHHVAIDFEHQTLAEGFAESIVDFGKPVFLSLLGVTQYLTIDATVRILCDVATMTVPGSELVFQFVQPPATLARDEAALVTAFAERNGAAGEPWLSYFEPAEMERHLLAAGFSRTVHFGPKEATERYLRGRGDGLCMPAYFSMIKGVDRIILAVMRIIGEASLQPPACSREDRPAGGFSPPSITAAVDVRRHCPTSRYCQDICGHAARFLLMDSLMSCATGRSLPLHLRGRQADSLHPCRRHGRGLN